MKKTTPITHNEYCEIREFHRMAGVRAEDKGDIERAEYYAGVVRGLDLAFRDGTAHPDIDLIHGKANA